ncbi:MAG: cadherin-like beta sandwich domain-containing protein, partial [Chloroflexi bacterium]|nr:cadherin-like beta sandwich domain-containing protein [Chloroflexota bacterium]
LGCPAMNDAVGADDQPDDETTSPYCKMYAGLDDDAKAVVDAAFANYYDVPLVMGANMVAVTVTAEDGSTMETYNITVTAEATSEEAKLLEEYDKNGNGNIDADELSEAILDYLDRDITPSDMSALILLYLNPTG